MKMVRIKFKDGSCVEYTNVMNAGFYDSMNRMIINLLDEPSVVYYRKGTTVDDADPEEIIFYDTFDDIASVSVS